MHKDTKRVSCLSVCSSVTGGASPPETWMKFHFHASVYLKSKHRNHLYWSSPKLCLSKGASIHWSLQSFIFVTGFLLVAKSHNIILLYLKRLLSNPEPELLLQLFHLMKFTYNRDCSTQILSVFSWQFKKEVCGFIWSCWFNKLLSPSSGQSV